jgi:hypothetical protein
MNRSPNNPCRLMTIFALTWVTAGVAAEVLPPANEVAGIGAAQAAEIARETTGGRVLAVRALADEEPRTYAVRLLVNPGHVRTVVVDNDSGRLR